MDQGSNKNHSPAYNFTPTVTKFCVMWEGLSLPHDTKFGNCRCKIVDSRLFHSWSLIHGLRWSGLIKVGPEEWSQQLDPFLPSESHMDGNAGRCRWYPAKRAPYLTCVSMAGRALLAGYYRCITDTEELYYKMDNFLTEVHIIDIQWMCERERLSLSAFFENRGHWGPYSPYKPFNHNLYIGIIIFPHIDNPQYTGYD